MLIYSRKKYPPYLRDIEVSYHDQVPIEDLVLRSLRALVDELHEARKASTQPAGPVGIIFPLFGIPFVVVALYFIFGRFFVDAKARANTIYGVTDRSHASASERAELE